MEAALVGVGTGAMKPLLSKLSNLLEKEYAKLKGVRRELESTRAEMCSMKAALEALAEAEQLDPEMTAWRDEVRELSFDMEDSVDNFMARADTKQDGQKGLKGIFDKLKKLKPRHEIAGEIKELKARAIEASERHKRYKLDRSIPDYTTCGIDPRLHALYLEASKLVGIEGPQKHIIDLFKDEGSSTQLRVVSIVGPGGLGKTTLGKAVFESIKEEFSCKAFVSVSRKPNMKAVLIDIARRVGMAHNPSNYDDEQWLIDSLREHLEDKKYLIVIDDLWSSEAWKTIKCALLYNEHGSRIITTTRNSAVASYCCSEGDYVYRMEPLSFFDSRKLFLGKAFRSEDLCPPNLKKVAERILEKCAGLPLAIITMSSLLADQTAEEVWNNALAAFGSSLAKEDGVRDMTKILSLSYFDLPHYMRACLLYLSAYPEDYIIEKNSLIHKWMAEGFVREVEGQSPYEVGEGYFNDFINRSLIQPAELDQLELGYAHEQYGEVMACCVHDIILDFITCKAKEENFMTSFGDAERGGKHKVRRLSVVICDNEMATVSGDLSHVRSLAHFGDDWKNFVLSFPVLRVLDIEGCDDLENHHLANIEQLLLLKYLRLRSYDGSITEIPEGIGKLKYLETLDMRGVTIRKLPSTMTQLQRLARLYANFKPACLSDGIIGQLQSLEELEEIKVSETEVKKFLHEVGQLTKLRTLSVCVKCSTLIEKVDNVSSLGTLISSHNLHHLSISYGSDYTRECRLLSLESWCLVNPVALRKICIDGYSIDKVPNWMISLGNLSVLNLRFMYCTKPEDIAILGGMPALVTLRLVTWYGRNGKIFIRTGFRSLKYFSLDICCCGTAVEFGEGSMPKLEHLELEFHGHKEECVNYAFDFGIHHLSALTKLHLRTTDHTGIIDTLIKTALEKFRHRPTLIEEQGSGVCSHFETAIEEEWQKVKEREKEEGEGGGPCSSFLGLLLEEIKQDALPRIRVMGMLGSLDGLAKSLCGARPSAAAESVAVAYALSEIQDEIRCTDSPTKAVASRHLSDIARLLLASPAMAAAAPDDLFVHLAQDIVPHLVRGNPHAIAEAAHVLAATPSAAFPVLFKPLTSCLASLDPEVSTAAAAAFCKLSAPPADAAPFLPLVPHLYNLLTSSPSIRALINVLRVLARLFPLQSSLVVDPVCQLLARSSNMFLTFQCIRTVLAAQPSHGASLAIGKVKDFLSGARDPNLSLLALGMLYPGYTNECHNVIALLLNDVNPNIRREALHLLMEMLDGGNIMGIAGMLVRHAAKTESDPDFMDEILGAVLAACARNVYELVMDFNWYTSLLADIARSVRCASQLGDEVARQLVDVGLRVRNARPELVRAAKILLIDPALLGNDLLCPVLSAAAWVSGEYAEFGKDPVELVEALLQPRTCLLPVSVRAVYIQAAHKVITSCCNIYLQRPVDSSNKELDVAFKCVAIDQTEVSGRSEAAIGSGDDEQIFDKDFFSEKSILHMIKFIEEKVGPLVQGNDVEVMERARNLIGFVHLIKEITKEAVSDDEMFTQAKQIIKEMQTVFSKELSAVSVNAQNHPDFRSRHRQGTLSYFRDAQRFESIFKMKRRTFNYICFLVKPVEDITLLDGRVLLLQDQVAIALRMFICGVPVETVLSEVGLSRSTFGLIFWRFVEAMLKQASHHLCWPDSMKMESAKSKFELIHGMPNCCGVVDTTSITTSPSAELNCEDTKNHNIAVQAVVDADTKIADFWVDLSGSQNHSSILHSSGLFTQCKNSLWMNGSKLKLSDGSEAREYIIGDAGYPLLPWLLTPYEEIDLSAPKLEFNRRHSAARTFNQKVLGRLRDTWKLMHGDGSLASCPQDLLHFSVKIIHVSFLLHNIVIDMEGAALEEERIASNHDLNYKQQACQIADENAIRVRDILSQRLANKSSKFQGTLSFLEDERIFESFFNMKRRTFNYICCLVKSMEDVRSYTFLDGRVMRSEDQVAVVLRMLISGGPAETVASEFSIKQSTVRLVTFRFVVAIMKRGRYHLRWPDSIRLEKIKSKFDLIHMLPNCCGVIDTTYISSAHPNHEQEKNYSMVVQVVVDPDMRFIDYNVEWPGTRHQSSILQCSLICKQREKGEWLNGGKVKLSDGSEIGEYIIGDGGFPLLSWLLTPYPEKDLSDPKVEFNRRLSVVRTFTLRWLARLKDTWKCLHRELCRPENPREFSDIIVVCCMLHNILIDMEGKAVEEDYVPNSCDVDYSQEVCQLPADENSVRMRDALSQYLASRPSRSAGDEEQHVFPSGAGDDEEQEPSGRKAEEETHFVLAN